MSMERIFFHWLNIKWKKIVRPWIYENERKERCQYLIPSYETVLKLPFYLRRWNKASGY
jgi:hypothetical protein